MPNNQTLPEGCSDIKWAPRVPKHKLRRLYQLEAQGIYDDELIDDIGWTFFMRCCDILTIDQAKRFRKVSCPRCSKTRTETVIQRQGGRDAVLCCPICGWRTTWITYQRTFKRKQLNPGGAVTFFETYVQRWKKARTAKTKMLAIDYIIHTFHYSLKEQPDLPTRPAGVNLIAGKLEDVVAFLDELSGVENSPELQETSKVWRDTYQQTWWPDILRERKNGHETDADDV